MGGEFQVRLAAVEDIPRLQEVEQAASEIFASTPFPNVVSMPGLPAEFLAEVIADEQVWVADCEGQIVGFAVGTRIDDSAHLHELSVDPAFQQRGIGTRLIETVIDWAACNGDQTITLSTFRDIPWNAPYYAKLGFAVIDESDLTDGLRDVRTHEADLALQVDERVLMIRHI